MRHRTCCSSLRLFPLMDYCRIKSQFAARLLRYKSRNNSNGISATFFLHCDIKIKTVDIKMFSFNFGMVYIINLVQAQNKPRHADLIFDTGTAAKQAFPLESRSKFPKDVFSRDLPIVKSSRFLKN